jgi:hypothetical protein
VLWPEERRGRDNDNRSKKEMHTPLLEIALLMHQHEAVEAPPEHSNANLPIPHSGVHTPIKSY